MAPLLGRQDSTIGIEWYAKVRHAPLGKFGTKFEHTNGQNLTEDFSLCLVFIYFCPKTGLNPSEDLFFWSSPNFRLKTGLNLSRETFFGFQYSQISCPPPPLSKILRTLVQPSKSNN